jgi:hypothetical protein
MKLTLGAMLAKLRIPRSTRSPKSRYEEHYRGALVEAMEGFRATIVALISAKPPEPFVLSELAEASKLHPTLVLDITEQLYLTIAGRAVGDGVVTPQEQAKLDWLAGTLDISKERALRLTERARRLK